MPGAYYFLTPSQPGQIVSGGNVVPYEASSTVRLPSFLLSAALAEGLVLLDDLPQEEVPKPEPEAPGGIPPIDMSMGDDLQGILQALLARNHVEDFNSAGVPRVSAVKEFVGRRFSASDIALAWERVKALSWGKT